MKTHIRQTLWLVAVFVGFVLLDVSTSLLIDDQDVARPELPKISTNDLKRLRIATSSETVTFEKDRDEWNIVSPIQEPADRTALKNIAGWLHRGISLDIQVEEDSQDLLSFGLEPGTLLEAYTGDGTPALALYIGNNTAGGASFVRLPDDETVYTARVGGLARYQRPAAGWRDPVVSRFDPTTATLLEIRSPSGTFSFRRSNASAPWTLDQDVQFSVDQQELTDVIVSLSGLRAGAILAPTHPAGLDTPFATVTLHHGQPEPISLAFGRTLSGAFVKSDTKESIYQIAPSFTEKIARPKAAWFNRRLLQLERTQIHRMTLTERLLGTTVLEQDPATNRWSVIRPANVDANLRECMQAALTLSSLQAFAIANISPENAGFPSPNFIEIEMLSGHKHQLELGQTVSGMPKGQEALFARTLDHPDRIAVLPIKTIVGLRSAFSR